MKRIILFVVFALALCFTGNAKAAQLLYSENFDDQDIDAPQVPAQFNTISGDGATYVVGQGGNGFAMRGAKDAEIHFAYIPGQRWTSKQVYWKWYTRYEDWVDNNPTEVDNLKLMYTYWNATGGTAYNRYLAATRDSGTSIYWSSMECREGVDGEEACCTNAVAGNPLCPNAAVQALSYINSCSTTFVDNSCIDTSNYGSSSVNMENGSWHKYEAFIDFSTHSFWLKVDDAFAMNVSRNDSNWDLTSLNPYITTLNVESIDAQTADSYYKSIDDIEIWDGIPDSDTTAPASPTGLLIS